MKIALCLSGGGFRALLFHLGVIRHLAGAGRLGEVTRIDAVSGGSVLAAHLVLHWDQYIDNADSASRDLLTFVERDVRGRIVRRRLFAWLILLPLMRLVLRPILPQRLTNRLRLRYTDLLVREYQNLYANAPIGKLRSRNGTPRPDVHFHTTSLTTGKTCAFSVYRKNTQEIEKQSAAEFVDGVDDVSDVNQKARAFPAGQTPLAIAVAASSAFPPMFQPVVMSSEDLGQGVVDFGAPQALTDGGVFDNLGVYRLFQQYPLKADVVIVSDAGGNLDADYRDRFRGIFSRNIRSSNLLMHRVGLMEQKAIGMGAPGGQAAGSASPQLVSIRIGSRTSSTLEAETLKALRNLRTDLDRFSTNEIQHLVYHGAEATETALRSVLPPKRRVDRSTPPMGRCEGASTRKQPALPAVLHQ